MKPSRILLAFLGLSAFAQSPPVVAIHNARVVPVSGPALAKATVVIRNGLIAEVGETVAAPPDAWVLEGDGLTVYPGLIEGLGSIGLPEAAPRAMPGALPGTPAAPSAVTPPSTPPARGPEDRPLTNSWVQAADLLRPAERKIETARSAGYTSAVTFPTGGIFTGQGAVINLAGDNAGRMVVQPAVGQMITMARGGFSAFPGSLMGTISYIRQVFLDADHYKAAKDLYGAKPQGLERPAYDRALEGVLSSPRILLPAISTVELERMIRFARELRRPAVLYGLHEGYRMSAELQRAGMPVLVSLKWPEAPRDKDPDEVDSLRTLELRDSAPSTAAALAKAGVKFAFYSDASENPVRGVRAAIAKGLTADEALRAMTLSVAEIFGVADRLGSIEKGKIANLVITKGDLFAERPQIQYVFVDGVRYEPAPAAAPAKPEVTQ